MHAIVFIQDLAVIMLIAGIFTILCHRFNQPVVLGYIIAGIIIGPYTPPFMFIQDEKTINILAELGVIFLLFSLGLEFDLQKLRQVGFAAFFAAFTEIVIMIVLGYWLGRLFNWSPINSLFLGAILAISSTTIIYKALEDLGLKKEGFAKLIFGILIIEDIFAIAILALLSTIATSGVFHFNDLLSSLTKLAAFLVISLVAGIIFVPKILAYVSRFKNKEMLLVTALGLCFGFCLLVIKLHYSVALGAFIMGAIIAESKQLQQIERLVVPLRDMFSAIFFVSVGLLFNPVVVFQYTIPIIVITILVVIGKIISNSLGLLMTGKDGKNALRVGMGLAQIGEFSFIIATLGINLKVTGNFLYLIAVAVSAITTLLTPFLIKHSDSLADFLARHMPKSISTLYERYLMRLTQLKPVGKQKQLMKIIKRSCLLILVNSLVVLAIFKVGNFIPLTQFGLNIRNVIGEYLLKTFIWNLALILSLPFLIALYHSLQALCMLFIEIIWPKHSKKNFLTIRKIISIALPLLCLIAFLLLILTISKNSLPPATQVFFGMVIPACLVLLLLPWFVKIHAKILIKFTEALKRKDKQRD